MKPKPYSFLLCDIFVQCFRSSGVNMKLYSLFNFVHIRGYLSYDFSNIHKEITLHLLSQCKLREVVEESCVWLTRCDATVDKKCGSLFF